MSAKAYKENIKKYNHIVEYLEFKLNIAKNNKEKIRAENKLKRFMKWLQEVPVVGFNSSKYDANIMKMYLSGA